jgi:hypothetical protein
VSLHVISMNSHIFQCYFFFFPFVKLLGIMPEVDVSGNSENWKDLVKMNRKDVNPNDRTNGDDVALRSI